MTDPSQPAEEPLCPKCGKPVVEANAVRGVNSSWHTTCVGGSVPLSARRRRQPGMRKPLPGVRP